MEKEEIQLPTQVETGITEIFFLDYFLLPLLMTLVIFVIFKKPIVSLVKKIEKSQKSDT